MPQMDFSTFFPQVFWLILIFISMFIFIFRNFFSTIIAIFKIKHTYLILYFNIFIYFFSEGIYEMENFFKTIAYKYIYYWNLNKFRFNLILKNTIFFNLYILIHIKKIFYFYILLLNSIIKYFEKVLKKESFLFLNLNNYNPFQLENFSDVEDKNYFLKNSYFLIDDEWHTFFNETFFAQDYNAITKLFDNYNLIYLIVQNTEYFNNEEELISFMLENFENIK